MIEDFFLMNQNTHLSSFFHGSKLLGVGIICLLSGDRGVEILTAMHLLQQASKGTDGSENPTFILQRTKQAVFTIVATCMMVKPRG